MSDLRSHLGAITMVDAEYDQTLGEAIPNDTHWKLTGELRWRRPVRGCDADIVLEQHWKETMTGEMVWHPVPTALED